MSVIPVALDWLKQYTLPPGGKFAERCIQASHVMGKRQYLRASA